MRAVFINNVNPGTQHVSGIRIANFSKSMSRRGHQVVLFTATINATERSTDIDALTRDLSNHDWSAPFHATSRPIQSALLEAVRKGKLPRLLRGTVTALQFAVRGGVFNDWVTGAQPIARILAREFRPDIVWSTFGNTSNLVLAQGLAKSAGVPWLMDIKDNWELYLRPGIRRLMARRFEDAAGFTANALHHATIAKRWHRQPYEVIYSGVAPEMIAPRGRAMQREFFGLTLIGAIYDAKMLARFVAALNCWLGRLKPAERMLIRFNYAGSAAKKVAEVLASTPLVCSARVDSFLSISDLAELCHNAAANCYLWLPAGFHHKLIELLACRRPVISFPGEHEESKDLARRFRGDLAACSDEAALIAILDRTFRRWKIGDVMISNVDTAALTWEARASKLEAFMGWVVENNPRAIRKDGMICRA